MPIFPVPLSTLQPVGARRAACPFAEGAVEGGRVVEAHGGADHGDGHVGLGQALDGHVPAQFILDGLEGGAFRRQVAGQAAHRRVQAARHRFDGKGAFQLFFQGLPHLLADQALGKGNEEPAARGLAEEGAEGVLVLPDRCGQGAGLEVQGRLPLVEMHRPRIEKNVLRGMAWSRIGAVNPGQGHLVAGQPGGDAVDQLEHDLLAEGVRGRRRRLGDEGDAHQAALAREVDGEVVQQQMEEAGEAEQGSLQIGRFEQAQAEELEGAGPHRAGEHAGQFVVQLPRQQAVEGGELLRGDAGGIGCQQGRRNAGLLHQGRTSRGLDGGAGQQVVHEADGDGAR